MPAQEVALPGKLAVLAGGGVLPQLIVNERIRNNRDVYIIAFKGFTDPSWVQFYPHSWVRLGQLGKALAILKRQGVTQIVFAGHVRRPSWGQIRPDWQGLKLLWRLKTQKIGDDSLLRQLAAMFQAHGLELVGADTILPDCLMPGGTLTDTAPNDAQASDVAYAARIIEQWARLDQGQSIVVQHGLILGVEAIEGTDELIRRCAAYKRPGPGPILVKIKKPQQDKRLDLPTIGEDTVKTAAEAGFAGIAVQEKQALFLQPGASIELANRQQMFITGFDATA